MELEQEKKLFMIAGNELFRKEINISFDVVFINGIDEDKNILECIATSLVNSIITGSGNPTYSLDTDVYLKIDDNFTVTYDVDQPKFRIITADTCPLIISLEVNAKVNINAILDAIISYKNPNIIINVTNVTYVNYFTDLEYEAALNGAYDEISKDKYIDRILDYRK